MVKEIKKIVLLFILLCIIFISLFASSKDNKYEIISGKFESEINKSYARNFLTFVTYGEYEKAFDLLTDECKSEMFENDIEKFTSVMQNKVYSYGRLPKTFTYEDAVKCANEGEGNIYSQTVKISHRSFSTLLTDESQMGYDVNEYLNVKEINFIIYEKKPYDYKMYVQLIES